MSAWKNIEIDASGLLRLRGGGIDISPWDDSDVYISGDDIVLNGYAYLWSSSSEDNRIATWGDLNDGDAIKPYYSANWFHLDYSSGSTIAVRDNKGTFVGHLDIRTS